MKDIHTEIAEIKETWKEQRKKAKYESSSKNYKESNDEYKRLEDRYYDLLKNSTILSGSVFASSIALAVGKDVGCVFVVGEFMLLLATIWGIIFLWNQLQVREWSYFMKTKGRLEGDLLLYEDAMEEFEVKTTRDHIESYKKLLDQKSFLSHLFGIVKPDWLPGLFYCCLVLGLVLIWVSLMV